MVTTFSITAQIYFVIRTVSFVLSSIRVDIILENSNEKVCTAVQCYNAYKNILDPCCCYQNGKKLNNTIKQPLNSH